MRFQHDLYRAEETSSPSGWNVQIGTGRTAAELAANAADAELRRAKDATKNKKQAGATAEGVDGASGASSGVSTDISVDEYFVQQDTWFPITPIDS